MICVVPVMIFLHCPTTVTCFPCIYCKLRRSFPLTCAENNIWNERRKGLWVHSEDGIHFHLAVLCFGRFPIRQHSCSRLLACVVTAPAIVLLRRFLLLGSWLIIWAQIMVFGTVTSSGIVIDTDDLGRPSASVSRVDTISVKNWTWLCAVDIENGHTGMTKGFDTARKEGTIKRKLRSGW